MDEQTISTQPIPRFPPIQSANRDLPVRVATEHPPTGQSHSSPIDRHHTKTQLHEPPASGTGGKIKGAVKSLLDIDQIIAADTIERITTEEAA